MHDTTKEPPAKLLIERHVPAGQGKVCEAWTKRVLDSARASGALEGSSVLSVGEELFLLLRFTDRSALARWESEATASKLLDARPESGAPPRDRLMSTGLETWFTVPGALPQHPPPKWKMALVTWCALLPQVLVLGAIVPSDLPFPLGPAVSTAIPVAMLTWVVMPRVSRLLRRWLYKEPAPLRSVHEHARASL